jgi:hypothetical protein
MKDGPTESAGLTLNIRRLKRSGKKKEKQTKGEKQGKKGQLSSEEKSGEIRIKKKTRIKNKRLEFTLLDDDGEWAKVDIKTTWRNPVQFVRRVETSKGWKGRTPAFAIERRTTLGRRGFVVYDKSHDLIGEWWDEPLSPLHGSGVLVSDGEARSVDIEIDEPRQKVARVRMTDELGETFEFYGREEESVESKSGDRFDVTLRASYDFSQNNPHPRDRRVIIRRQRGGSTEVVVADKGKTVSRASIKKPFERKALRLVSSRLVPMDRENNAEFFLEMSYVQGDHRVAFTGNLNKKDRLLDNVAVYPLRPDLEAFGDETFQKRFELGPGQVRKMLRTTVRELQAHGLKGTITMRGVRITGARNAGKERPGVEIDWLLNLDTGRVKVDRRRRTRLKRALRKGAEAVRQQGVRDALKTWRDKRSQ